MIVVHCPCCCCCWGCDKF